MTDAHTDDVLNRLDALLNKDKADKQPEAVIPLLTEVYTPSVPNRQVLEELLPVMVNELEEMMKLAIIELRPKTEALLRQHLEQALARHKVESPD
jgi:hypothetical protein